MIEIVRVDPAARSFFRGHDMESVINDPARHATFGHGRDRLKVIVLVKGDDFKALENALFDQVHGFFGADPAGQGQGGKHGVALRQAVGGADTLVIARCVADVGVKT